MDKPLLLYQNYLSSAAASATDSYSGSAADNVFQATEDTYWRPADTTGTKNLDLDLAQTLAVTAIGLVGEGLDGVVCSVYGDDENTFTAAELLADAVNLSGPVNCAWLIPDSSTYRYYRFSFSSFGSAFRVAWVCLCAPYALPFFTEDPDVDNLDVDGSPLISPQGLYLGGNQQKSLGKLSLDFGNVTSDEYPAIEDFRRECLLEINPFILVPDQDDDDCYFGWSDGRFSAPYRQGMRAVSPITMTTRAA